MNDAPEPRFGDDGLVTTVVQDATTSEVLMVAHMNREAWEATLRTRRATSRLMSTQAARMAGVLMAPMNSVMRRANSL